MTWKYADKTRDVIYAERALWVWAAWVAAYGFYQTLFGGALGEAQSMVSLPPATLRALTATFYMVAAASVVGLALQVAQGKKWARITLLLSFLLQAVWELGGGDILSHLADAPDLGLQGYALYMLYRKPSASQRFEQGGS
jgi:hypothetical protein